MPPPLIGTIGPLGLPVVATDPPLSMPELPMDASESDAQLLIRFGSAHPAVRPLAVKLLGSRGFAPLIPAWAERASAVVEADAHSWQLPGRDGSYADRSPIAPEPEVFDSRRAAAITAASLSDADFFTALADLGRSRQLITADATPTETAIIALLPHAADKVHHLVSTEDGPHCTVCYLSADDLDQVRAVVARVAATTSPITAAAPATDVLGDQGAHVLLLESPALLALRTKLTADPTISAAMAKVDQFPQYIPHLTLSFPDDGDGGSGPTTPAYGTPPDRLPPFVHFDKLGVWNGDDDRTTYPLTGAPATTPATATTAATANGTNKVQARLPPESKAAQLDRVRAINAAKSRHPSGLSRRQRRSSTPPPTPLTGSAARAGTWHAPFSGHQETISLMLIDLLGDVSPRSTCGHPGELFVEACSPDHAVCGSCAVLLHDPAACAALCAACGASLPTSPAARARGHCDVGLASDGRVNVVAALCAKCSRVARSLVPTAKSVHI